MPVWRYVLSVGGSLLALMFVADFYLPQQPQRAAQRTYNIPIASSVRGGPQAITFSGETRNFGPPPPLTVVDFSDPAQAAAQAQQATQAHAQMTGPPSSAKREAKPARQKVAKRRISRQHDFAHLPSDGRRDPFTGMAFFRSAGLP